MRHPYRDLVKPGVRFVQTTVRAIDPAARSVETDAGRFEGDVMVVALGADLDPGATPGLVEAGHEFYTVEGAFALREVLSNFDGGRVIVGVTSTPFKCPPAPSETVLLMHDYLAARGLRDRSEISLVMPLPAPIPPSPAASQALVDAFAERDIGWYPNQVIRELDPTANSVRLADGTEMPYDLFLGVPTHHVPAVVAESGMTVEGWIPVNPLTLETPHPGCSRSETSPASGHRRPASFPSDRRQSPPSASSRSSEAAPPPRSMTATACATSSSDTKRLPESESRSGADNHPPAPMKLRRRRWPTRRPSSGPAAYNGGLIVPGPTCLSRRATQDQHFSGRRR